MIILCRVAATAQKAEAVHALSDNGARKRVRRQLVHHAPEALGDFVQVTPQRAPGEGLVSEPPHETQEAQRTSQGPDQGPKRLTAASLQRWIVRSSRPRRQSASAGHLLVRRSSSVAESSSTSSSTATSAARRRAGTRRTSNAEL